MYLILKVLAISAYQVPHATEVIFDENTLHYIVEEKEEKSVTGTVWFDQNSVVVPLTLLMRLHSTYSPILDR